MRLFKLENRSYEVGYSCYKYTNIIAETEEQAIQMANEEVEETYWRVYGEIDLTKVQVLSKDSGYDEW